MKIFCIDFVLAILVFGWESLGAAVLVLTHLNLYVLIVCYVLSFGLLTIRTTWGRAAKGTKPTLYCSTIVNVKLFIGSLFNFICLVLLFIVNWKVCIITLLACAILGKTVLYSVSEVIFVWPIAMFLDKLRN